MLRYHQVALCEVVKERSDLRSHEVHVVSMTLPASSPAAAVECNAIFRPSIASRSKIRRRMKNEVERMKDGD